MGNEHWVKTTLDNVVLSKKGKKPAKLEAAKFKNSLPYIDIEAFETGKVKQFADANTSNHCQKKDILVVWDGARFGLTGTNQMGAIGSTLACLTPILIESSYLHKFIQRHYVTIQQKPKGMATPHVDPDVFWNLEFPLPPLPEQKRIVEKLDAILPKVKSVKARLEKIPHILRRFRQSVLASACSGKLTEDWSEEHICEIPDIAELSDAGPFDIPLSWKWSELGHLCHGFQYGTSTKSEKSGNVPVLRMGNLQNGLIDWTDLKYTNDKNEIKKYFLSTGDVLFNRTNSPDLVGKTSIYKGERPAIFAGYLIKIKNNKGLLLSEYLNVCLNATFAREWCKHVKTDGVSQSNINAQVLSSFPVPLPPLEEQHEIVRRVEKLFKLADSLEAKYKKAMERVEKIEQSVISKAFRGELAPQDPNDEPAEELLKRILAEKVKIEVNKKKTNRLSSGQSHNR